MAQIVPEDSPEKQAGAGAVLLRAEHLQRVAAGKTIVRDASFALQAGEVVAITGPSGAGKSSLLRLLNRLNAPIAGHVWLEGIDTATLDVHELRRRIGMVMQQANLFPGTVAENIAYGPRLRAAGKDSAHSHVSAAESAVRNVRHPHPEREMSADGIQEMLATVGLSGYADRDVAALSGGEAQRVSIARTLANRPLVLLLDEPTSSLDEAAKRVVEEALRAAMAKVEGACLIVTHDAEQAARLAQRTLIMRDGVLHESEQDG